MDPHRLGEGVAYATGELLTQPVAQSAAAKQELLYVLPLSQVTGAKMAGQIGCGFLWQPP
jgi:hypothetical protein